MQIQEFPAAVEGNVETILKEENNIENKMKSSFVTIDEMVERVEKLPVENFYFPGFKENSLNFVVAQAKVGKTTMAENLAMCIAAGQSTYLGSKVWSGDNKRVLVFSLEEFFRGRTERNKSQMNYMDTLVGHTDWHQNFFVSPDHGKRYIDSKKDWEWLIESIKETAPAFTVIDSLSRMQGSGEIEDSSTCIELMRSLTSVITKTGTTLLVIHHTTKMGAEPLTLNNMAGSRILAQEADAIIALNKTPSGKRYIKPLAFRYADDSCETVKLFTRNEHQWLIAGAEVKEYKLMKEFDNRTDNTNAEIVLEYIQNHTAGEYNKIFSFKELEKALVDTKTMSKPTLISRLDELINEGMVLKPDKGKYMINDQAKAA